MNLSGQLINNLIILFTRARIAFLLQESCLFKERRVLGLTMRKVMVYEQPTL